MYKTGEVKGGGGRGDPVSSISFCTTRNVQVEAIRLLQACCLAVIKPI